MTHNYHDENYDGICLKIPAWFIRMNPGIVPAIEGLREALKDENLLSAMHPDHTRNVYELENYEGKAEALKVKKENAERERKIRSDYVQKQVSGEVLETELVNRDLNIQDTDTLFFNEDRVTVCTRKSNLTAEAENRYTSFLKEASFDEWVAWLMRNHLYLRTVHTGVFDYKKSYLKLNSYGNLTVVVPMVYVKIVIQKPKGLYGVTVFLEKREDCYYISSFKDRNYVKYLAFQPFTFKEKGQTESGVWAELRGYDFDGFRLTKKLVN